MLYYIMYIFAYYILNPEHTMITIRTNSTDPYYNLAAEEYFLKYTDLDVFMLWQNHKTAVIGKNQNVYAEINLSFARENGITVIRRMTGGGAVYHDLGNVNYTFITSKEKSGTLNFAYFTSPIISSLESLGVKAELSGRNDILCGGLKVSGNAQFSDEKRVLHHGTLLFDTDLSLMPELLTVDPAKIQAKSIKSVRSRVANIKSLLADDTITVQSFMDITDNYVSKMYNAVSHKITPAENEAIMKIREKYTRDEWNFPAKGTFDCRSKKYGSYGLIDICYSVKGGVIENISIYGDFFGVKDITEISQKLTKIPHSKTNVKKVLENTDISEYISGITKEEFINMLFE